MTRNRTLSLILPAFGAAIIAALAQIVIPIGAVPITLQTFAVGLVAAITQKRFDSIRRNRETLKRSAADPGSLISASYSFYSFGGVHIASSTGTS